MPKPVLPYWAIPSGWFLNGTAKKEAEAKYSLTGIELERRIAEINLVGKDLERKLVEIDHNHGKLDAYQRDLKLLKIDGNDTNELAILNLQFNHHKITAYDYDVAVAGIGLRGDDKEIELVNINFRHKKLTALQRDLDINEITIKDPIELQKANLTTKVLHRQITEYDRDLEFAHLDNPDDQLKRELAVLAVRRDHGKITEREYGKAEATLNEKPWLEVIDSGFDPERGVSGVFFEFDWNEFFIAELRSHGYAGGSEDSIVEQWFSDVCRAQGLNAVAGGSGVPFGF